jgi:hypothetical protein
MDKEVSDNSMDSTIAEVNGRLQKLNVRWQLHITLAMLIRKV